MADTAGNLIAGAMGSGYAGLSSRQCWMALLALYSGGMTPAEMTRAAALENYPALSDRDLDKSILNAVQT